MSGNSVKLKARMVVEFDYETIPDFYPAEVESLADMIAIDVEAFKADPHLMLDYPGASVDVTVEPVK